MEVYLKMNITLLPSVSVHDDGTFDIQVGELGLCNAYPALDHEPIHPLQTRRDHVEGRDRIIYTLADGAVLELQFFREGTSLAISAVLSGRETAPHWVHPVATARVEGAERFFRTGIGFSGPTNFVNLKSQKEHYSFESYLFTGLVATDHSALVISVRDVDNFMQKSHVENRLHRHQFRNREISRNVPYFEAGFSTECILLPDKRLHLPTLYFSAGAESWALLRQAATDLAQAAGGRVSVPSYHYGSFYQRSINYNQNDLQEFLSGLEKRPEPLQAIQIDDGYFTFYGDWLEPHPHRFPDGMKKAFSDIRAHGYNPGVWVGPFMVSNRSRIVREHPDWLLHWADGRRVTEWRHYLSLREDEEAYVLDTSHPEAMAYLSGVFRTLRDWGVRFFKTDFLEWGHKDSTLVRRHTPGKTSTQYFRDTLRMIRKAIGEDSYWLGCITYFAPCVGFMDGMRVSSDVGVAWNDAAGGIGNDGCGGGIQNSIEESHGCQFFNNLLWQNDPDVIFFREDCINLTEGEIRALAYWNGILGVSINTSDDLPRLAPERLGLWRFVRPQKTPWTAHFPYWEGGSQFKVAVRAFPAFHSWAVVILNDNNTRIVERFRIQDWIGLPGAFLYEWGPEGAKALGKMSEWIAELAGHRVALLYVSGDNTPPPPGLTLGGWQPLP